MEHKWEIGNCKTVIQYFNFMDEVYIWSFEHVKSYYRDT